MRTEKGLPQSNGSEADDSTDLRLSRGCIRVPRLSGGNGGYGSVEVSVRSGGMDHISEVRSWLERFLVGLTGVLNAQEH